MGSVSSWVIVPHSSVHIWNWWIWTLCWNLECAPCKHIYPLFSVRVTGETPSDKYTYTGILLSVCIWLQYRCFLITMTIGYVRLLTRNCMLSKDCPVSVIPTSLFSVNSDCLGRVIHCILKAIPRSRTYMMIYWGNKLKTSLMVNRKIEVTHSREGKASSNLISKVTLYVQMPWWCIYAYAYILFFNIQYKAYST